MALPPIISNLPIFKMFTKPAANGQQGRTEQPAISKAQDEVTLSSAAQKLSGASELKNAAEALSTAAKTGALLQQGGFSLGLDPGFN